MIEIENLKRQIIPILEQYGVRKASLFGSVARGEEEDKSDTDILVELDDNSSLLDIVRLQLNLEDVLRRKVDVVEYEALKPAVRSYISRDEIVLYDQRS